MRRRAPRPLAVSVAALADALAPATPIGRVQRVWAETVGAAIAREAEPVSERGGVVTVACRSAVWAQELDLLAPDLLARLETALGARSVAKFRFVTSSAPNRR